MCFEGLNKAQYQKTNILILVRPEKERLKERADMTEAKELEKKVKDLISKEVDQYFPLDKSNGWNILEISHETPSREKFENEIREKIQNETGGKNGLYVYLNGKTNEPLYVGEGILARRMQLHYGESFEDSLDKRGLKWYDFFHAHQTEMKIFWKELEIDKNIRRLIEQTLSRRLKPKFPRIEEK